MLQHIKSLFYFDPIAMIMLPLALFVGACVASFSFRFMKGDTRYGIFFFYLSLLITSIGVMTCADHLLLFFGAWCMSNFLLVRLMIHKSSWEAAKNSGVLAAKNYLIGALCVGTAFLMLSHKTGEPSIRRLIHHNFETPLMVPIFLLLIGGMTQSAIWPFHRWLLSSLNSPTPVSAIMHAGLINGGGFLLARFAPLYLENSYILTTIFCLGIATALIGTFWKLLQNDVKRMLACSTMGQMGFMLAQCGLGLFPAAIAHLVTHGMFKAHLFLAIGSTVGEKQHKANYPPKMAAFIGSLTCGFLGSLCFSLTSGKSWFTHDTTLVLMIIVFLTASQSALSILSLKMRLRVPIAIFITAIINLTYGFIMSVMKKVMQPMHLMKPQDLNGFHIAGIALLVLSWLSVLFFKKISRIKFIQPWIAKGYVAGLNTSQPHPKTVTSYRNNYKYL